MTGRWAATNTLRKCIEHDDLLRDKALAALSLVEAALDAAQPMANLPYPLSADERQQWLTRQGALAAALRAVREGNA